MSDTFCREGEQTSERNDGNSVQSKDGIVVDVGEVGSDAGRNEDEKDVEPRS